MTDTFEELRIIAMDARGLDRVDRDLLKRAANELEETTAMLIKTQAELIACQRSALDQQKKSAIIKSITFGNFNSIPMISKEYK